MRAFFKSTLSEILAYHRENPPKGECVMIIEGNLQRIKEESQEVIFKDSIARSYETLYGPGTF